MEVTPDIVEARPSTPTPAYISHETGQLAFDIITAQGKVIEMHAEALDDITAQFAELKTELDELRLRVQDSEHTRGYEL